MAYRALSDREWAEVAEVFPKQHMGRPRQWTDRQCLEAVLYVLNTGCWKELPSGFPPKSTAYDRYVYWVREGILQKALHRARKRLTVGKIFYIDSSLKASKKGALRRKSREVKGQQN
jgi:transposase